MPIPDSTYFGERPEGGGITYGEVRALENDNYKLNVIKRRLDTILINQTQELAKKDDRGAHSVWSPFPLMIMTFIGIETLGRCILHLDKIKQEFPKEESKGISTKIYQLMDVQLTRKPTKKFYRASHNIHNKDIKESVDRYSDLLHTYQRNTFTHGYQAKGVYLTHELQNAWECIEDEGYLLVNPYLFWDLFKSAYNKVWNEINANVNSEWRFNAFKYLEVLLK